MKAYKNYIFDLYGTLVDIHTNEQKPSLWKKMSALYEVYGATYSWRELKKRYFQLVHEEEEELGRKTGVMYPEIRLENVFRRLLIEKPDSSSDRVSPAVESHNFRLEEPDGSIWLHETANIFRILSRERFGLYPNTLSALQTLKRLDCRLFMLSNAQAVFTRPEIEICGLTPYFEGIYLSSEAGCRKPQRDFLERMLKEYGLDLHETVLIGNDISTDMKIADICGIDGILLNTDNRTEEMMGHQIRDCKMGHPERIRIIQSGDVMEAARR